MSETMARPMPAQPTLNSPQVNSALARGSEALRAALTVTGRQRTEDLKDPSPYEQCLPPFLDGIGWLGEPRRLIEALPHFDPVANIDDFRLVLANIGIPTRVFRDRPDRLTDEKLPCVFVLDDTPYVAIRRLESGDLVVFDGLHGDTRTMPPPNKIIRLCTKADLRVELRDAPPKSWFGVVFKQFRSELPFLLLLTFVANVMARATPLFSMSVYNNIVVTAELPTLIFAVVIVVGALVFEDYIRRWRTKVVSISAARLNATILREGFGRILSMPLSMTLNAPVAAQSARLKQFEGIFNVFAGGLAVALLDIPFTLVFFAAIALIGGYIALVPLVLMLIFMLLALVAVPLSKSSTSLAGRRRAEAQEIARQTIVDADTIRSLGAERVWMRRLSTATDRAAKARFQAAFFDQLMNSGSQLLTVLAGVTTLFFGAAMVINDQLSIGGLIAVMMFVWRLASPIQTAFLAAHKLLAARDAVRQIDRLMTLPTEQRDERAATLFRNFKGAIRVENLAFRHPGTTDLALRGLSFSIPAGQMVAITGLSGAGKTTLLSLLLGAQRPLGGSVFIDELNLAQLDPSEVRSIFGYSPEKTEFFFGTLAQNIRLAQPTATDEEIEAELGKLGVDLSGPELEGLQTRVTGPERGRLTESMLKRVALTRALVKKAPIYLLDSPTEMLDTRESELVRERLIELRGKATVLIATAQPRLIEICDRALVLKNGQIIADTPAKNVAAQASATLNGSD